MLLTHELDETTRGLVACRKRIAKLVAIHDGDKARLGHQQGRIMELRSQVKMYREKLVTATVTEVADKSATLYQLAYQGR